MGDSSDSDYTVEEHVRPQRVRRTAHGDSADVLGNFDDAKRQEIMDGTYEEKPAEYSASDAEMTDEADENTENNTESHDSDASSATEEQKNDSKDEHTSDAENNKLSKDQVTALLRGASKTNRHVLYVTNLNFETSREDLESHFGSVGTVKSVRIPKKRRGGFAFVEMADLESYQRGFQLHNTMLQGRTIKVQFSEAGKRKSANKKNIIKQKNRKLAEMRNEQKTFTKSGKFYDKSLKKEKAKELLARKRWRKPVRGGPKS